MSGKHWVITPSGLDKQPGWFSWRHKTRDACDEARETYLANRGPAARRRRADERRTGGGPERLLRAIFGAPSP